MPEILHRGTEYQLQIYLPDNEAWLPVLIKDDGEHMLADFWYSDQVEVVEDANRLRGRIPSLRVRVISKRTIIQTTAL